MTNMAVMPICGKTLQKFGYSAFCRSESAILNLPTAHVAFVAKWAEPNFVYIFQWPPFLILAVSRL